MEYNINICKTGKYSRYNLEADDFFTISGDPALPVGEGAGLLTQSLT
jgi:hypothetical protein